MSAELEWDAAEIFDATSQRWTHVTVGLDLSGSDDTAGRTAEHLRTAFLCLRPSPCALSAALKEKPGSFPVCRASSLPAFPTTKLAPPASLTADSVVRLQVSCVCPRAARLPLSRELRAGLQLSIMAPGPRTYVSHTSQHSSSSRLSTPRDIVSPADPKSMDDSLQLDLSPMSTQAFFTEVGSNSSGPALMAQSAVSSSAWCSQESVSLQSSPVASPLARSLEDIDSLNDLLEVDVFGVVMLRGKEYFQATKAQSSHPEAGLEPSRSAGRRKRETLLKRFGYNWVKSHLGSLFHLSSDSDRRIGRPRSASQPEAAICSLPLPDNGLVSLRLRFHTWEAMLVFLRRYTCSVRPPPLSADSTLLPTTLAEDKEDSISGLPHRHWEHFLKWAVDPRYDLPFATPPIYLWYSWRMLATHAVYMCERGWLSVEETQDPKEPVLSPIQTARHHSYRENNYRRGGDPSSTSWDTVRLVVGTPTPPQGRGTLLHPEGADGMSDRLKRSAGLRFRDIFLCLSETHLLFYNSFGELKIHVGFDHVVAVVFPTAGCPRQLSQMPTYPFITFLMKAGRDEISEPPLTVTFTLLPVVPHQQDRAPLEHPSVSGSSLSSQEAVHAHRHQLEEEIQHLYERKDMFLVVFRTLCPRAERTTIDYDTYLQRHMEREVVRRAAQVEGRPIPRDAATVLMVGISEMTIAMPPCSTSTAHLTERGGFAGTPLSSAVMHPAHSKESDIVKDFDLAVRLATHSVPFIMEKADIFLSPLSSPSATARGTPCEG